MSSTMSSPSRRTDRASRLIAASPETLYAAQLDPAALTEWLPPPGSSLVINEFHPSPGGAFGFTLTFASAPGKTTSNTDDVHGRFVALEPPHRVVTEVDFTSDDPDFAGTMRMIWTFDAVANGTQVTIVAEDVPPGITAEDHAVGLASSLENLARYTET